MPWQNRYDGRGGGRFLLLLAGRLVLTSLSWDMPDLRPRRAWGYAVGLAALLVIGLLSIGQPTTFLYFQL